MNTISKKFLFLLTIIAMIGFVSCADDDEPVTPPATQKTITATAQDNGQFTELVKALTRANLAATLEGPGPYTVFAPTNGAFTQLYTTLGVTGVDQIDVNTLTQVLLNHVVSGEVKSTDLTAGYVNTLADGAENTKLSLLVDLTSGVKLNNNAEVSTADIDATNGVIHEINAVMLPPNIVAHAINNGMFNRLVEAVVHAGLDSTLSNGGPYTVFAPTDAAFDDFIANTLMVNSITDVSASAVADVLLNHVVSGNVTASEVMTGVVPTLGADDINVDATSGVVLNTNINVVATDVQGTNGVIHVIDKVIN